MTSFQRSDGTKRCQCQHQSQIYSKICTVFFFGELKNKCVVEKHNICLFSIWENDLRYNLFVYRLSV